MSHGHEHTGEGEFARSSDVPTSHSCRAANFFTGWPDDVNHG